MPDFSDILKELREQFLQSVAERFARIETLVAALETCSPTPEAENVSDTLTELLRQFHSLSGVGGTYGFPNISQLGRTCEEECELLLQNNCLPETRDLERWRLRLDTLKAELKAESGRIA